MSTSTFYNWKYALKPVICEGRLFSVICHVEAVFENFRWGLHIRMSHNNVHMIGPKVYCAAYPYKDNCVSVYKAPYPLGD